MFYARSEGIILEMREPYIDKGFVCYSAVNGCCIMKLFMSGRVVWYGVYKPLSNIPTAIYRALIINYSQYVYA